MYQIKQNARLTLALTSLLLASACQSGGESADDLPRASASPSAECPPLHDPARVENEPTAQEPGIQKSLPTRAEQETSKPEPMVGIEKNVGEVPRVKRLVVASQVEKREPIALQQTTVDEPVFAFVELEHRGSEDSEVVVTFQHKSGKKVGFIQLDVPAESPRYRTWGRTRNIHEPGTWSAVISTKGGQELARQDFTVQDSAI